MATSAHAPRYGLRAGGIFDGVDRRGPGVVLVDGVRIAGVLEAGDAVPDGVAVTDLGADVTLLPGLIDTHVHLVFDAGTNVVDTVVGASDDELLAGMRARARTALTAGITTMRDLGDRRYLSLALRSELAADPHGGPELLCAGPPVTTPKGHCWFLGGAVDGEAGLRAAVAERAARGVDVVKVMATGGEMTPGSEPGEAQFSETDLRVLVTEAHRHGLPVAAHAHAATGIANALAAGVDTIEHCSFMSSTDVRPDHDLIDAIAASGTIVSLSLGFAPGGDAPPPQILAKLPKLIGVLRGLATAGVVLAVGTDAGITPQKPHDALPYGAVALTEIGLAAERALAAVTSTAARACGVADHKGRLAAGHDADLLAVRGDPVADIRALHDVVAVYRAGTRVAGARRAAPAPPLGAPPAGPTEPARAWMIDSD